MLQPTMPVNDKPLPYALDYIDYSLHLSCTIYFEDIKYSQPSVIRNSFIRKPRCPDRISMNGHAYTTASTTFSSPEIRYPEDIFKVPKVLNK